MNKEKVKQPSGTISPLYGHYPIDSENDASQESSFKANLYQPVPSNRTAEPQPQVFQNEATDRAQVERTSSSSAFCGEDKTSSKVIFEGLDSNAKEVQALEGHLKLNLHSLLTRKSTAYRDFDCVRGSYRRYRATIRDNRSNRSWKDVIELIFNLSEIRSRIHKAFRNTHRKVFVILLDLIIDVMFCVFYLVQINTSHPEDSYSPKWLWVSRSIVVHDFLVAMSWERLASRIIGICLSDLWYKLIFSTHTLIDLVTLVPLIVSSFIPNGRYLFVPYFFRSVIVVWQMRRVLHLRNDLSHDDRPYDPLLIKLSVLSSSIIVIIFNGMAAFQYCEMMFGDHNYAILECIYFVFITISTVGYGDIYPESTEGKVVVVIIIILVLIILPSLISETLETFFQKQAGGGTYHLRRSENLIVICGQFDSTQRVLNILNAFLHTETYEQNLRLILLGKGDLTREVKALVNSPAFKNRVAYLRGSPMDEEALKRAALRKAEAVFILSDQRATSPIIEDENNSLRTWSIHLYAPHVPIYTYNIYPSTKIFQRVAKHTLSSLEIQQSLLAFGCICPGSATFIVNLLQHTQPIDEYSFPWEAQYDDGRGNEIYIEKVNSLFVGRPFSAISWFIYCEFQIILFAVKIQLPEHNHYRIILNPGAEYCFTENDECLFIGQAPEDIEAVSNLTSDQFNKSMNHFKSIVTPAEFDLLNAKNSYVEHNYSNSKYPTIRKSICVGLPGPPYLNAKTPLCHILKKEHESIEDLMGDSFEDMKGHILICAGDIDLFSLISTLRSAHITSEEYQDIVVLRSKKLSHDEFNSLRAFPDVHFVEGSTRQQKDLLRAGVIGADKVLIVKGDFASHDEEYIDSSTIITSQLIQTICGDISKKFVFSEIVEERNVRLIQIANSKVNNEPDLAHAPVYAAGRTLICSSLDSIIFEAYHNESIISIVSQFLGIRYKQDFDDMQSRGVASSYLCLDPLPEGFMGKSWLDLYRKLTLSGGIIPVGILRAPNPDFGNQLPFVFTNPVPSVLLKPGDQIYVLRTKIKHSSNNN
ncbi:hypothetical protein K7432_010629 [Basidiobolus ranarum]|uniref:RCK N-terminal domain-containing protein n=1 Tax=Basidiobolus ranarum TaxID=34480 RepID=A0ABR2WNH9_9FUNG